MLSSLPIFVAQMGLRLKTKFDRDTVNDGGVILPNQTPPWARTEGLVFCVVFFGFAAHLYYVHHVHFNVFRSLYEQVMQSSDPVSTRLQTMMSPRRTAQAKGRSHVAQVDVELSVLIDLFT